MSTIVNGKETNGWNKAFDVNGNPVYKVFYLDGTSEIVRGIYLHSYGKFYKSLSGLRASKFVEM